MKYDTIVEIGPDGRPMLRLVIVPDDLPYRPYPPENEDDGVIIIPPPSEEKDPHIITWDVQVVHLGDPNFILS